MSKVILWFGIFWLPFGLLFTTIGLQAFASDQRLEEEGLRAPGTVIRMASDGGSETPVVEWTDHNGERHQFYSSYSSTHPSHQTGDEVTVIYRAERPEKAKIDGLGPRLLLPAIFTTLGSIALLIGVGFVGAYVRHRLIVRNLMRSGLRIEAEFVRCKVDRSTHVNGRHPIEVVAKAKNPRTGRAMNFKSRLIWKDLSNELKGQRLPVFIDPRKPSRHIVDLSEWVDDQDYA